MLDYCARASWPTEADVPLFSDAAVGVAEERLYLSSGFGGIGIADYRLIGHKLASAIRCRRTPPCAKASGDA
jgi:hypothetical protein